ncbi:ferrochelatase [Capnocytophaga cynodegmi]|uniref:ferrochelatase n=1 Tax=Capnocytophaga cynodegmi TaxID=28189 RepID=UPI001EE281B7|nr:ferrochelatase [Capnocytophaga cynodegmi]GJQ06783.1 ferrochelatase [Capnocytophaga cynodegmi]
MSKGVLLVNLGSPDSTKVSDVRRYLDEFLMDSRVIDLPYLLRVLIVRGIILRVRPKKSAKAYKKIWWEEGSPLIVITERLVSKLQKQVSVPVQIAMRYGNPSIEFGLQQLREKGVTEVLLLPMYPQYAMATTETVEVLTEKLIKTKFKEMTLTKFPAFYNRSEYVDALAKVTKTHLNGYNFDHLLFSYHGVPERHLWKTVKTDNHKKIIEGRYCCDPKSDEAERCYRTHCFETTRQLVERLQLTRSQYSQAFQSRLGIDKWLEPFTSDRVVELARSGVRKLAVITPAFVADCIETLEEIEMEAGKEFLENGGEEFKMIPCLNDDDAWVYALATWIHRWEKR